MANSSKFSYKKAGVDIDAGKKLVDRIKSIVSTIPPYSSLNSIGGFGGLYELSPNDHAQPVLVAGTDGVGTKANFAIQNNNYCGIGIDLVAMCVNDIAVLGAKPLFFLDYYSTQKLDIDQAEAVIQSIAEGCKISEMALLGGETAEHPISSSKGEFDIAGFCVGIVDKKNIIDGSSIEPGDTLIGINSSGIHANGFSLIHSILSQIENHDNININGSALSELLLEPTLIYSTLIQSLIKNIAIKGISHITGGGLTENLPRGIPKGMCPIIDLNSWEFPPLFSWVESFGIEKNEMLRTFNCGIGMVICVNKENTDEAISAIKKLGFNAWSIGVIAAQSSDITLYESR